MHAAPLPHLGLHKSHHLHVTWPWPEGGVEAACCILMLPWRHNANTPHPG